jgi:thiamine-phosphate pyrophosphorylase
MLIVISSPIAIENEANLINQLFDEGMELFHLRKPDYNEDEIKQLIFAINPAHYSKLVFHQHHYLAKVYSVNRLHFTEVNRRNIEEIEILSLKTRLNYLSTSVHSYIECKNLSTCFDYAFLGPVFDSISKKDYKAVDFKNDVKSKEKRCTKLIALGGITKLNLYEPLSWGFDGVAVLGSIWENENPVKEFIQIKNACSQHEVTH